MLCLSVRQKSEPIFITQNKLVTFLITFKVTIFPREVYNKQAIERHFLNFVYFMYQVRTLTCKVWFYTRERKIIPALIFCLMTFLLALKWRCRRKVHIVIFAFPNQSISIGQKKSTKLLKISTLSWSFTTFFKQEFRNYLNGIMYVVNNTLFSSSTRNGFSTTSIIRISINWDFTATQNHQDAPFNSFLVCLKYQSFFFQNLHKGVGAEK